MIENEDGGYVVEDRNEKLEKGPRVHDYERAGYKKKSKCDHCGSTENLIVHHKDHDHSNNSRGNHETICRTCHSKEHADQRRSKKGRYKSGVTGKMTVAQVAKFFTAPSSPTGGIQGYDLEGNKAVRRAGVRLRPKRQRMLLSTHMGRAKITPIGEKR